MATAEAALPIAAALARRGDHAEASRTLSEALGLWRGEPLVEFAGEQWAASHSARLAELRLALSESRIEAELACGGHAGVVPELEQLTAAHPLREQLWALRILALYRAGRQAEALRAYQDLRCRLAEELGLDPSPQLRALEAAVLAQDSQLAVPVVPVVPAFTPVTEALPTGVVTFLLTDIVGSTPLWERDPAAMADALARHDRIVADAVLAEGGFLVKAKGEGDSTLSVFHRATAAARAAVTLQGLIAAEAWRPPVSLRVRMALHTGEAYERDGDYFGPTVNRAARLRGLAGPDAIVVSAATAALLMDQVPDGAALIDTGPRQLAGLERDEQTYALVTGSTGIPTTSPTDGGLTAPAAAAAGEHAGMTPLVGRDAATADLASLLEAAVTGRGNLVVIVGEAGIGKTRLAEELVQRAGGAGAATVWASGWEGGGAPPYWPWIQVLRQLLALEPSYLGHPRFSSALAQVAPVVPEAAAMAELRTGTGLDPQPADARFQFFDAVGQVVAACASRRPLVVVLDDVQWADEGSLSLLEFVAGQSARLPLLIVATSREHHRGLHGERPALRTTLARLGWRIELEGLTEDDARRYLTATMGVEHADLAAALHRRTGGNPFFIREVVRLWRGAPASEAGGDAGAATERSIPGSVRQVVRQRLQPVTADGMAVLSVAALLGEEFEPAVVAAVLGRPVAQIVEDLQPAVDTALLGGEPSRYRFTHALVRETIADDLRVGERSELNLRIGEVLEGQPDVSAARLAAHFAAAGPLDKQARAGRHFEAAGDHSMRVLAFEQAAHLYRLAVESLPTERSGDRQAVSLRLKLAEALDSGDRRREGEAVFSEALAGAQALDDPELVARAALGCTRQLSMLTVDPDAVAILTNAFDGLRSGPDALAALLAARLAVALRPAPGSPGAPWAKEATDLARSAGDPAALARVLSDVHHATASPEGAPTRLEMANELLALAEGAGAMAMALQARLWRMYALLVLGDAAGARAAMGELRAAVGAPGAPSWSAYYHASRLVTFALLDGRFAEADRLAQEARDIGVRTQIDDAPLIYLTHRWLVVAFGIGDPERLKAALRLWDDAPGSGSRRTAGDRFTPLFLAHQARLLAALGETTAAHAIVSSLVSDPGRLAADPVPLLTVVILAETCGTIGAAGAAPVLREILRPWSALVASENGLSMDGPVIHHLGILACVLREWDEAERSFETALVTERRMGALPWEARTQAWYAHMLLQRGSPTDQRRARKFLADAARCAGDLGMIGLGEDIRRISEPLLR